jgi:hypothetical protein
MECPASVQLSAGVVGKQSVYASYGTVLHDVAAFCLKNTYRTSGVILTHEEDAAPVDAYLKRCRAETRKGDEVRIEVTLKALHKIDPDLGGTADFIRWRPLTRELLVVDFKTGSGVDVEAADNRQMMIYALGAMLEMGVGAEDVTVLIVQPRLGDAGRHIKQWTFKGIELLDFAAEIQKAAEATRDPDPRYNPSEKVCRWCPAGEAGLCEKRVSVSRRRVATVSTAADFDDLTQKG